MNPPAQGTGKLTLSRVALAASAMQCNNYTWANFIQIKTLSTSELSVTAREEMDWVSSRPALSNSIANATHVLLGFGDSILSGPARHWQRNQALWLAKTIQWDQQRVVWLSGRPLHPSRWNRETFQKLPGEPLATAVAKLLHDVEKDQLNAWATLTTRRTPPEDAVCPV